MRYISRIAGKWEVLAVSLRLVTNGLCRRRASYSITETAHTNPIATITRELKMSAQDFHHDQVLGAWHLTVLPIRILD